MSVQRCHSSATLLIQSSVCCHCKVLYTKLSAARQNFCPTFNQIITNIYIYIKMYICDFQYFVYLYIFTQFIHNYLKPRQSSTQFGNRPARFNLKYTTICYDPKQQSCQWMTNHSSLCNWRNGYVSASYTTDLYTYHHSREYFNVLFVSIKTWLCEHERNCNIFHQFLMLAKTGLKTKKASLLTDFTGCHYTSILYTTYLKQFYCKPADATQSFNRLKILS